MASALDRALNQYKQRVQDQSGATKTKVSLIFDPKTASFIQPSHFYKIGIQGFASLSQQEPKLKSFSQTLFSEKYSEIDPSFLNKEVLVKLKALSKK